MASRRSEYVSVVVKNLGRHVSGWPIAVISLSSLVLTALLLHFRSNPDAINSTLIWTAVVSVAAVLVLGSVAQYDAWKEERETREKYEEALNAKADLRGSAQVFVNRQEPFVHLQLNCSNHGQKACQISRIAIFPYTDSAALDVYELDDDQIRSVGTGEQFRLQMIRHFFGDPEKLRAGVNVRLLDSVGGEYALRTVTSLSPIVATE
jgi:hypothetical protein